MFALIARYAALVGKIATSIRSRRVDGPRRPHSRKAQRSNEPFEPDRVESPKISTLHWILPRPPCFLLNAKDSSALQIGIWGFPDVDYPQSKRLFDFDTSKRRIDMPMFLVERSAFEAFGLPFRQLVLQGVPDFRARASRLRKRNHRATGPAGPEGRGNPGRWRGNRGGRAGAGAVTLRERAAWAQVWGGM